jgi:hypothetical protein
VQEIKMTKDAEGRKTEFFATRKKGKQDVGSDTCWFAHADRQRLVHLDLWRCTDQKSLGREPCA